MWVQKKWPPLWADLHIHEKKAIFSPNFHHHQHHQLTMTVRPIWIRIWVGSCHLTVGHKVGYRFLQIQYYLISHMYDWHLLQDEGYHTLLTACKQQCIWSGVKVTSSYLEKSWSLTYSVPLIKFMTPIRYVYALYFWWRIFQFLLS